MPDYAFQYTREYAKYGVVHELGHVWDRRTALDLSNGLMVYIGTLVCEGMGGCRFDISAGKELPPGYPRFIGKHKNYAGTTPMEDWAEAFASTIYPNYYSQFSIFNGTDWEKYWLIGPMRKHYVLDQINNIK